MLPPDAVRKEFGADSGATAFVELDSAFGKGFKYCIASVIHRNNAVDAYTFFLYKDPEQRTVLARHDVFYSLKFK
jgi:hypothetical protein